MGETFYQARPSFNIYTYGLQGALTPRIQGKPKFKFSKTYIYHISNIN